jgi:hypothetical protein
MNIKEKLRNAKNAIDYQSLVLQEVQSKRHVASWSTIKIDNLSINVCPLLAVGDSSDPLVVMGSATLQQLIADELQALLPTSKVMDEMFKQAGLKIDAITHPSWVIDQSMGLPHRLVEANDELIKADCFHSGTLNFGGWKSWLTSKYWEYGILREGSEMALNHGLYLQHGFSGAPKTRGGSFAYQSGDDGAHGRLEIDYSQCIVLMSNKCYIDCKEYNTVDVLASSVFSHLLSYDGPIKIFKQPGNYSALDFQPHPALTIPATLKYGDHSATVLAWQKAIGARADGIFGPFTLVMTKDWQN